jgi:hypothetical protein
VDILLAIILERFFLWQNNRKPNHLQDRDLKLMFSCGNVGRRTIEKCYQEP